VIARFATLAAGQVRSDNMQHSRVNRGGVSGRGGAVALALAMLLGVMAIVAVDSPPVGAAVTDTLTSGSTLPAGSSLQSADGRFVVAMQDDGNLVLYAEGRAVWSNGFAGLPPGSFAGWLAMQTDGNLVQYAPQGRNPTTQVAWWNTRTHGNPGARAVIQNDGNFVVYSASGRGLWSTQTDGILEPSREWTLRPNQTISPSPRVADPFTESVGFTLRSPNHRYVLVLQHDGNLVLYKTPGIAVWQSTTYGALPATGGWMGGDGNLVLANARGVRWQSGTAGHPNAYAVLQDDGNFVIYSTTGRALWNTGVHPM